MVKNKFTFIDLFAGAGGLTEGFKQVGFEPVFANDIWPCAAETYTLNHAGVSIGDNFLIRNIKELHASDVFNATGFSKGEIDGIVGGPACQGFSLANSRTRLLDNPANGLIKEFIRFVGEVKPRFFVMENVDGLVLMNNGTFKESVEKKFKEIGYPFVCCTSLCAADYGVPQIRNRVFFVGMDGREFHSPKPKLKSQNYLTIRDAIGDLPQIQFAPGKDPAEYANGTYTPYQKKMRVGNKNGKLHNHIITKSSDLVIDRYKAIKPGKNWKSLPDHLRNHSLRQADGHSNLYKRLEYDKPSITITNYRKSMLIHPVENRGLSVREAARLQSFKDKYVFKGSIGEQQQLLANVVPPLLAKAVAESIKKSLT